MLEISLKSNYGYSLEIKAENVHIVEDVEDRIYHKKEDGKTDFQKAPIKDINTDILNQFIRVLDDLFYYRKKEYDSCDLIKTLFKKLPEDKKQELITYIKE